MKLKELFEGNDAKCKTLRSVYSTRLHDKHANITVSYGKKIKMSKKEAEDLESDLHYAIEKVLAKFYD